MGGAYLLAKALHDTADYQEAFRRYEQQMSAYVLEQQKSGRSFAKFFLPSSSLGLFVQQAMMKVLFHEAVGGLLRRQLFAPSILHAPDVKPEPLGASPDSLSYPADPCLPAGDRDQRDTRAMEWMSRLRVSSPLSRGETRRCTSFSRDLRQLPDGSLAILFLSFLPRTAIMSGANELRSEQGKRRDSSGSGIAAATPLADRSSVRGPDATVGHLAGIVPQR
ncbi:hypothetical protein [Ktedonobacter sp. SOSP1-52]|uniref:hypothetical protein n=1 Tax=Ktedonobacter sp. SOSP1-52 TaxID=2778366 RepID=UPI0019167F96|nr:hypothetical protein [Ktedonobacter sp. SOSP1-52]